MRIERKTAENLIRSINNFEVDNRSIGYTNDEIIDRNYFWENIYVNRERSENNYEDFIKSQTSSLLIINGHVGIGKSTFIRHKFEKLKLNSGLIIDLKGKREFNNCTNQNEVDEATFTIIKNALLNSMFENIKISLYKSKKYIPDSSNPFYRYDYNLETPRNPIELKQFEESELNEHVNFQIAIEAITYLHQSKYVKSFKKDHQISGFDALELRKKAAEVFEDNPGLINEVTENIEWNLILILYRILFGLKDIFVIAFDNFDVVPLKKVKNYFLETLITISNVLNGNIEFPFNNFFRKHPVKIIFSIRDENISRFSRHNRAAFFDTQIIIGNDGYLMTNADKAKRIPIDKKFCYQVIKNRLIVIEKNAINLPIYEQDIAKLFVEISNKFWIDGENETIRTGIGYLDIQELSNDSIRLILDFITDATLEIIPSILKDKEVNQYLEINFNHIKGKILHSLWNHKSTQEILDKFKNGVLSELNNQRCCLHRLTLAFLYNCPLRKTSSYNVYTRINEVFGCTKEEIQNVLFDLHNSELKESELITVYQNNMIDDASEIEISKDTELKLNPKGIIFIERIIIHPDYFSKITEDKHEYYGLTHSQLNPDQFIIFYKTIFYFLKELAQDHKYIFQMISHNYNKYNRPFDGYRKDFTIKSVFYIERVCQSHKFYIKKYIISHLLKRNLLEKYTTIYDDEVVEKKLEQLKDHTLNKIWFRYYKRISSEIQSLLMSERIQY